MSFDSVPQDEGRTMSAIILITPAHNNHSVLMPENPNKDVQYRMGMFIEWLDQRGIKWFQVDLAAYRDFLLKPHEMSVKRGEKQGQLQTVPAKSSATVAAHLASIRGRYTALLRSNSVRQDFYDMAPSDASAADKKAFVDEVIARLQNAVHPTTAAVKQTKKQDEADSDHLRLKPHQATTLLNAPDINTFTGIRNAAIIALSLCTGIREAELTALDVDDLRQAYDGELALRVQHGKGDKQRMIPYGALEWCLVYVDKWLSVAGITEGAVFRGFYRGGKAVRPDRLTTRSINDIMNTKEYWIEIDGSKPRAVNPHDMRRSYARMCYDAGMDMLRIQQNLGHRSLETTQIYIGALGGEQRRPPAIFNPPRSLTSIRTSMIDT